MYNINAIKMTLVRRKNIAHQLNVCAKACMTRQTKIIIYFGVVHVFYGLHCVI